MKVIFRFKKDLELDARNWWEACNRSSYGYDFSKSCPKKILKKVKGKKWGEIKNYLKKTIPKYYKTYDFCKNEFIPFLKKHEGKIVKKLEKIHERKFPVKFVDIYYTSFPRSPYGGGEKFWIQINGQRKDKKLLLETIVHELMHLFFHKYYWKKCEEEKLKKEQIHDIKESFSVLINEEFKDLKLTDRGYNSHKDIRVFIEKEWKKSKNFEKVLEETIQYYKKRK